MELKEMKIGGTATIGTKGQVVIPKYVRDHINLKSGDEVIFLIHGNKFLGITKNGDLAILMEYTKSFGIKVV